VDARDPRLKPPPDDRPPAGPPVAGVLPGRDAGGAGEGPAACRPLVPAPPVVVGAGLAAPPATGRGVVAVDGRDAVVVVLTGRDAVVGRAALPPRALVELEADRSGGRLDDDRAAVDPAASKNSLSNSKNSMRCPKPRRPYETRRRGHYGCGLQQRLCVTVRTSKRSVMQSSGSLLSKTRCDRLRPRTRKVTVRISRICS
jgi:hypothetical protein